MFTVGVYDSGIGGLTVLNCLVKAYPYINFLYLGDNENAPYGTKSANDIFCLAYKNLDVLSKYNPDLFLIACNTVSTVCGESLKNRYNKDFLFVKPGESIKGDKVLVVGTPQTISNALSLKKYPDKYFLYPEPALAGDIERNVFNLNNLNVQGYFKNLPNDFDRVYLACTHYPFVKRQIKKIFKNATVDDGLKSIKSTFKSYVSKLNLDVNYIGKVCFVGVNAEKNEKAFKMVLKAK